MAKSNWNDLSVGDFFTANINMGEDTLLYQKINDTEKSYNAILLNKGLLCCLATDSLATFEKVEVTFDIKPTE
jgi:hypothetical protein